MERNILKFFFILIYIKFICIYKIIYLHIIRIPLEIQMSVLWKIVLKGFWSIYLLKNFFIPVGWQTRVRRENLVSFFFSLSFFFGQICFCKVLLVHSHASSLVCCLGLLSSHNGLGRAVLTDTDWPTKPKIFTVWPFTEQACCPLFWNMSAH